MKKAMIVILLSVLSSACASTGYGTHGAEKPTFVGLPLYKLDVVTHQKDGPMNRMVTYNTVSGVEGGWWSKHAETARSQCWNEAALVYARELCPITASVKVKTQRDGHTTTRKVKQFDCRLSGIKAIEYYLDGDKTMHCLVEKSYDDYLLEK